jgi:hypothetical protein
MVLLRSAGTFAPIAAIHRLELPVASRPDGEGDHLGSVAFKIIRQRVQLLVPMGYAVARPQPIEFGAFVVIGSEPVIRQSFRFAFGDLARHGLDRLGNAPVQLLPARRQQALIGDIAHERVLEPEFSG